MEVGQQDFTRLRLSTLHCTLDFRRLEQRAVDVHRDFQLAGAGLVNVGGKLHQVFTVEVGGRVGGWQIPFGLGKSRTTGQGQCQRGCGGGQCKQATFHEGSSC